MNRMHTIKKQLRRTELSKNPHQKLIMSWELVQRIEESEG